MNGSFTSLRWYFLTYRDFQDVQHDCPDVKLAAAVIQRNDIRAVSDYFQSSGKLLGVPADLNQIRYLPIAEGRWLNDLDVIQKRAVVVIGDEARRVLFPGWPSVGATILLNGVRFEVIGTLKRIGHGENNTRNLEIYIPFSVMRENFPPLSVGETDDAISYMNYQPKSRALPVMRHATNVWKVRIDNPKLLVASRIVIRVGSELSEDALRKIFVNQATVGSADQFEGLWKSRLPGIPLKPLHSQPREIPYDGDRLCLELDQKSEHWASLLDAPGFVIGVSGVLPSEPQVDCYSVNR